jgi:hypothetical protein
LHEQQAQTPLARGEKSFFDSDLEGNRRKTLPNIRQATTTNPNVAIRMCEAKPDRPSLTSHE